MIIKRHGFIPKPLFVNVGPDETRTRLPELEKLDPDILQPDQVKSELVPKVTEPYRNPGSRFAECFLNGKIDVLINHRSPVYVK